MRRNPLWDGPDPFGLGPERDDDDAPPRPGRGPGVGWPAVVAVIVVLAALAGWAAAGPVPCEAQAAAVAPPVAAPLAPPVVAPTAVVHPAPAPRPAPAPATTYRRVRERVEAGERLIVLVNPPPVHATPTRPGWATVTVLNDALAPGRYAAYPAAGGTPVWEIQESYAPQPATAEGWYWLVAPPGPPARPGGT